MKFQTILFQFVIGLIFAFVFVRNISSITMGHIVLTHGSEDPVHRFLGVALIEYAFLIFWLIVAVAVHELGHVVGAIQANFEIHSVTISLVEFRRVGNRFRMRRAPRMRVGGLVRALPRDSENLPQRMQAFIAGGPIASLVLVALAFLLEQIIPTPPFGAPIATYVPYVAVVSLFTASIFVLPGTLIPMTLTAGMPSDMRVLLQLWRKGEGRERLLANYLLARAIFEKRPREWSPELLAMIRSPRDGSVAQIGGDLLNYYASRDRGRLEEALGFLSEARGLSQSLGAAGGINGKLALLLSALEAARSGQVEDAEEFLRQYRLPPTFPGLLTSTEALTEAALALARPAFHHEIQAKLVEARRQTEEYQVRYSANQAMAFELIDEMQAELDGDRTPQNSDRTDRSFVDT